MKKKIVIPVVVIMVVALAGTAMARGGFQNGFQNGGPAMLFDQLTPEKQQEVKTIFQKYEDKFETIRIQMWAKRIELNALVESGKAEKKDITALVTDMVDLRNKSYNLRKQISDEIEQATGIAMPVPGSGGFDMDNGRMGPGGRGPGRHQQFPNNGDCRGCNF